MPGIYIHIPFCKQACHYCDFHFSTTLANKNDLVEALKKEIGLRRDFFLINKKAPVISTIYFGGGTPSLLNAGEINGIINEIRKYFQVDAKAEITLEANPDDLTREKLNELKSTPINRLSIGIQSFYDDDLLLMNRAHNAEQAGNCVALAKENGFGNITIDLIYGLPTLSNEKWKQNLQKAFDLDIQHISCYHLTVEERTALHDMVKKNKVSLLPEERSIEQFKTMVDAMRKNGFMQYEISNFCREGSYSKHNSAYWKKNEYLGLGPSAHSYNGMSRMWNVANNNLYIKALEKDELPFEEEALNENQKYNEYVMTTLRTMWGVDLSILQEQYGDKYLDHILLEAEKYFSSGHMINRDNKLFLSEEGKLIADRIASDLFWVE
jgi:oxygen-independent coproporphyrinogen-3 oxidase